ncbi:unnamed protein product [Discosporangium mesarthrocarpum]
MTSSLSETINHMSVEGIRIWTGCDFICNGYDNGADVAFYMCRDKIGALTTARLWGGEEPDAVLGCQATLAHSFCDQCIRVLSGSEVVMEATVDGAVGALHPFVHGASKTSLPDPQSGAGIAYGTDQGVIGHLASVRDGQGDDAGANWLRRTWEIKGGFSTGLLGGTGNGAGTGAGGVATITAHDLTQDGVNEMIVGRENGLIQVYRFKGREAGQGLPEEAFSINLGETIQSVKAGCVSNPGNMEVVAATYRGRVCALTTESLGKMEEGDFFGRTVRGVNNSNRFVQLSKEVQALEKSVAQEKEKLERLEKESEGKGDKAGYLPATPHFQIISSCQLDPKEAVYIISLEAPMALDMVVLYTHMHMDVLDCSEDEGGQAIKSSTTCTPEVGGGTCVTYRCQEDMTRLVIKARTTEGDYGEIRLTVVAKTLPKKTAQVINFPMKPLSLHHRLHSQDLSMPGRPVNTLKLTGSFSLAVIHDWIGMCLPGVPPIPSGAEELIHFQNVYTGSVLSVEYRKGEALVRSDSVSSVAIIKELVSREATARRMHISDNFQGNKESVPHMLRLIHPKLQAQFSLAHQMELINALKEISMQENDAPWLSKDYKEILNNVQQIQKEFKGQPRALEYASGTITDLYVDWHKFRGDDAKHHIVELENLLLTCNCDDLIAFFLKRP